MRLLNSLKCKVIHLRAANKDFGYKMGMYSLETTEEKRELGALADCRVTMSCQCMNHVFALVLYRVLIVPCVHASELLRVASRGQEGIFSSNEWYWVLDYFSLSSEAWGLWPQEGWEFLTAWRY